MVKTTEFNVQTQMNYVVGNMSGFTAAYTGMDNLSALLSSLMTSYTTMAGTGRAAYLSLGAAISAVGLKSAEAFGEYQRGMNMVKAISNNTNAQMQMLSQSAQQFSGQFRMGIEDINDGLVTLGRAGLTDVNNQIEVLKNGLQVAKISGMDLASTLEDIVTTTSLLGGDIKSNTFGAETKEIGNLLVATSLSGPLNVSDVIETLKFAGGSAAAAGATLSNEEGLHDLLGTIGAFSQKGVTGSIAGTALRAFITKPASQDQKVSDALAKLGLDAYSLWEKDPEQGWHMKPIAEQIGMITKAMNDNHLTNLDRIEVWGDIVGNKMGQQMLKLDENRIKETTKDIEHQRNLEDIYQGTLTNFASQVERLNQIFQAIYRNIGSGFASMLTGVVQGFADILEFVNSIGNGILFKAIAPLLGPLGLYGLAKGLKDFVELLGMLKANIRSSLERPIKGQALYQPYEDWETSRRGGGRSFGMVQSTGTISITGPTTINSSGDFQSYSEYKKDLRDRYASPDYRNTKQWQDANTQAKDRLAETQPHRLSGNFLSRGSIFDISLSNVDAYTDEELADLQLYESSNRAMRYIGEALLESEELVGEDYKFTDTAIASFTDALQDDFVTDDFSKDDLRRNIKLFGENALESVKKNYPDLDPVDSTDPDGKRLNPEFANAMVRQLSKRFLDAQFKKTYGQEKNFSDMLEKGMDLSMHGGYLNIPFANLEAKVASGEIEEGSKEYQQALTKAHQQYGAMKKAGGYNYLSMIDQTLEGANGQDNIMRKAYNMVNRGLENVTLDGKVQAKVDEELKSTLRSIEAVEEKYSKAATNDGQAIYRGVVQYGMGINSPGYIFYKTKEELERVQLLIEQFRSKYAKEGQVLGSELVKAFGPEAAKMIDPNQMYDVNTLKARSTKFLTFDVESTGVDTAKDAILQYGAAVFQDGQVIDTHKTRGMLNGELQDNEGIVKYKPDKTSFYIPDDSKKVHKLEHENFSEAKGQYLTELQALQQFQSFVEDTLGMTIHQAIEAGETIDVVTHNGKFDFEILRATIDRVNNSLIQAGVSADQLIPDITRVFNKVDTYDIGRKMIEERYGTGIEQGIGPKGNISLGFKFKQSYPHDPKAEPGEHDVEIADEKLDSFSKLFGVRLKETHDALNDAIDSGYVYLALMNRAFPDDVSFISRPKSRFFDPTNENGPKELKQLMQTYGEWLWKNPAQLIELFEQFNPYGVTSLYGYEESTAPALFRAQHISEPSNLDELKKLDANVPLEVLGRIDQGLDEYAYRYYGPLEAIEQKILQLEQIFGPIYKVSKPIIDQTTGKALMGVTPFSHLLHDDLHALSDYDQELDDSRVDAMIPSTHAPRGRVTSPTRRIGKQGVFEGELLKEEDIELTPYGSDVDLNMRDEYLSSINSQFETAAEIAEASLDNILEGLSDPGSVRSESIMGQIKKLFESGIFSFMEKSAIELGATYIARNRYGEPYVGPEQTDDFYEEHGYSAAKPLSADKGFEMFFTDPRAVQYQGLEEDLNNYAKWLKDHIESVRKKIQNKTYQIQNLTATSLDAHKYLMRVYGEEHPENTYVQDYNRIYNQKTIKRNPDQWDTTNFDQAVDSIVTNLLQDGMLTPLGESFFKEFRLGFAEYPSENILRQEVRKLLREENLPDEYHTTESRNPNLFRPEEDNTSVANVKEGRVVKVSSYADFDTEAPYVVQWDESSVAAKIGAGMVAGLENIEDVIEFANSGYGVSKDLSDIHGGSWYLDEEGKLHNSYYEKQEKITKDSNKSVDQLAKELTEMERIFYQNNKEGIYYNFRNVSDKAFKTIDDVDLYKQKKAAYEEKGNLWLGSEYYISRDKALENLDMIGSDRIQELKERTKYSRYTGMDGKYAGTAARYAQNKALDPNLPITPTLVNDAKQEAVEQFKSELRNYLQKNAHLISGNKKNEKLFKNDVANMAHSFGLSLNDMVIDNFSIVGKGLEQIEGEVQTHTALFGTVLREYGSSGIIGFLDGIQARSPPKSFTEFIRWVGELPQLVLAKAPILGEAAFIFGRAFDINFRNGANFHSPVKAIDDFDNQADKDLQKGEDVFEKHAAEYAALANEIGNQIELGFAKAETAVEKMAFLAENMTALDNVMMKYGLTNLPDDGSMKSKIAGAFDSNYDMMFRLQKEAQSELYNSAAVYADTYFNDSAVKEAWIKKSADQFKAFPFMEWANQYQEPNTVSFDPLIFLKGLPGVGSVLADRILKNFSFGPNESAISKYMFTQYNKSLGNNTAMRTLLWGLIKQQINTILPQWLREELFGSGLHNLSEESFKQFLDMSPEQLTEKYRISPKSAQYFYDQFSYERTKYGPSAFHSEDRDKYRWEVALNFQSRLRQWLQEIPGVGEASINKLYKQYGTIEALLLAPYEEVAQLIGKRVFKDLEPALRAASAGQNRFAMQEAEYYALQNEAVLPRYITPMDYRFGIKELFEGVSGIGTKSIEKLENAFGNVGALLSANYSDIYNAVGRRDIARLIWDQIGPKLEINQPQPKKIKSSPYYDKDFYSEEEYERRNEVNKIVSKTKTNKKGVIGQAIPYDVIFESMHPDVKKHHLGYGHLTAEEFLESKIIKHLDKSTPVDLQKMNKFSSEKKDFHTRMSEAYGRSSLRKELGISPEQKIQQRNQRAIEKWTQELIKGSMTQEQYGALLDGLIPSGRNFEAELQEASMKLNEHISKLMETDLKDEEGRAKLTAEINKEIATIETLNEAKRRETTASIAAAEADAQESVTGRLGGFASAVGGMAGKLANGMFGLMMNPYVMLAQMVWGYVQQGIEMIRQQEEEKISKLSEIASNAESSYDEQTSKWEEAQSKANEKFGDLSDNEKQDQMLEAIQKAREDNNSASAETKALLGKQNALISASDNMINAKMNQGLTGYKGAQANWEEFMQGSGMVGSKDEFGLMDYIEGFINPDKFKNDSNTARIQAMADATIQIDTRVKNMEEMTEDYQKVMASFGVAGRSMLDIYNVRGILSDDFFSGTFFDPNSSQRIGAPGFRSAEQLAMLMKKEEKILQRFENRYLRFARTSTNKGDRITVTLGEGSIHDLANQLGVKDVEAAQMLAVHELQRIQDVMLNQVEPELAQTAISMYQGAYTLEQNKNLNDVQAAFQSTMTQGIFAIQAQVAQLVYKATMEQALSDYQAATGDTETDTIGLLLNRARDTSYKYHDQAKQFASQGWGGFMQARDLNHLVNQGYTQEEAMNKLLEQGKDGDYYKKLYGEQLGKYEYNGNNFGMEVFKFLSPLLGNEVEGYLNYNNYDEFSKYTDWMMKSYAGEVPLDQAIQTLNDAQTAADSEGDNGKDTDTSDADKQRYVQLAICNKKAIPKLNVNLFKKAPTFTVLNKNFKLRDIKINTADKAKNIENSLKNAIIDVQERSDPKIIQDSEGEYDPVGATDDATNLPTGASLTK